MKTLDKNWITSGLIDFEYKKYILMAYLQEVRSYFDQTKLYPFLSDLIFHYQNLKTLKDNKQLIYDQFPKIMSKADFEQLTFSYEQIVKDDDLMCFLEEIISYSLPQIQKRVEEGKEIYEIVEDSMSISPIGLSPLLPDIGYFFIYTAGTNTTQVYQYQVTIFENTTERFRGIHTTYLESVTYTITNTFENIKLDLIRRNKNLPNPATYLIECRSGYPLDETLLPVAKRLLVKYLAALGNQ
jgi:hypothetical protein